jgi:hypothetical protein
MAQHPQNRAILENADLILRAVKPDVVVVTPVRDGAVCFNFSESEHSSLMYLRDLLELQNPGPIQELKDIN